MTNWVNVILTVTDFSITITWYINMTHTHIRIYILDI